MISDFVEYLQTEQLLKLSVVIEATEIRQKHTVHYLLRLKYTFNGWNASIEFGDVFKRWTYFDKEPH